MKIQSYKLHQLQILSQIVEQLLNLNCPHGLWQEATCSMVFYLKELQNINPIGITTNVQLTENRKKIPSFQSCSTILAAASMSTIPPFFSLPLIVATFWRKSSTELKLGNLYRDINFSAGQSLKISFTTKFHSQGSLKLITIKQETNNSWKKMKLQ